MGRGNLKGGRPPKPEAEKMSKLVSIYLTPSESKQIDSYLAENNVVQLSKSEFFRIIIMNTIEKKKIVLKKTSSPQVMFEINRIGINLNQIVKKANSIDALSEKDVLKLNNCLDEMSAAICRA